MTKEKVCGIGGLFFRAQGPDSLGRGTVTISDHAGAAQLRGAVLVAGGGPTVFAPFPATTEYFGDAKNQWMVNFRVVRLDALVEQLRAAGISVEVDPERYPNGRFARLVDPEGNPIQLWQPEGREAPR